ncbi:MAG: hypothetical protein ACR2MT_15385 [Aurantibacter sp.]
MTSIKEHCCGADSFFDEKMAEKQYRQYLKKGPSRVTRKIIEQLSAKTIEGKSLIDVGGGIGALQWWFLQKGGAQSTSIEASSSYIKQSEVYAEENNWGSQTDFILGDFTDVHPKVDQHDYITLDKVICCYPDFMEIIKASCQKAKSHVSLSYPVDGLISKALSRLGAFLIQFKTRSFRPYIHSVDEIRATFERQNYKRIAHTLAFPFHVETYRRI